MNAAAITGAAGAIGEAAAGTIARHGWRVWLLDNDGPRLEAVRERMAGEGACVSAVTCDVASSDQVEAAFRRIEQAGDTLLGLVNSAAVLNLQAHLLDLREDDWDRIIAVNLKGVFLCSQAAARLMVRQRQGAIVNLGSLSSRRAHRQQAAYDAAKGGVEALTRAMSLDLAPYGIRVNAVLPAAVATETMVQHSPEEFARKERLVPLGRYARPEEVAEVCEFLICRGSFITGQCIVVDGGLDIQLRPIELEHLESPSFERETAAGEGGLEGARPAI